MAVLSFVTGVVPTGCLNFPCTSRTIKKSLCTKTTTHDMKQSGHCHEFGTYFSAEEKIDTHLFIFCKSECLFPRWKACQHFGLCTSTSF